MSPSEILTLHGLRQTPIRLHLIEALQKSTLTVSENELKLAVNAVFDRTTFYRALQTLMDSGVIHRIVSDPNTTRYALNACRQGHHVHAHQHVHFVCSECGAIECLSALAIPAITPPDGYEVSTCEMIIRGRCPKCATKAHSAD